MKISSNHNLQLTVHKNPFCPKCGNRLNTKAKPSFPRKFRDFLRRKFHFLVKRSSLDLFVTFCGKTKSKRNHLATDKGGSPIRLKKIKIGEAKRSSLDFLLLLHQGKSN